MTGSTDRRPLYFVSPLVDGAVLGGASMIAFGALWLARDRVPMETIYAVSATLLVVVNWPHFSATVYRLYHSRANVRQYPITAIVVPLFILGAVWASLAEPETVAPYFVKLYLIWSPYHFSGQSLGISLLYARRAGVRFSRLERTALAGFIFGTFVLPLVAFETGRGENAYYGVPYPTLGLPVWTRYVAQAWLAGCAVALVVLFLRWKRQGRSLPPWIVFLPAVTQFVWFVPGARLAAYNEFVPAFHSLQYLFIAWSLQLKERLDLEKLSPSGRYVVWESIRWLLVNIVGGLLLFEMLPLLFQTDTVSTAFVTGVVFAAVQVHHFFVDGVIWKLKSQTVSSPLMGHLGEILSPRAQEVATTAR